MTLRHIFIMLEAYFFMLFCVPFPVVCAGNAAGLAVCGLLIVCTVFFGESVSAVNSLWNCGTFGKTLTVILIFLIVSALVYTAILTVNMLIAQSRKPDSTEPCTVIILGCRVKGTRPTRMLRKRLSAAFDYLQENPQAVCIVSGGQGSDEEISEAEAMKTFLLKLGLGEERIYSEPRSTSTFENLKFSQEIILSNGLPQKIAIATDGFHQYRAKLLAQSLGMSTSAVPSATEPRYLPTYWVREWFGITKFLIKGK